MVTGDWIITSTGALLALGGLALLARALLADRLRTRCLRRAGALRRCPHCWYDMLAVEGLTCPECGRKAARERTLRRSRRHWRLVAAALLVLSLGVAVGAVPHGRGSVWSRWLPDAVVIVLVPLADDGWPLEEMARRLHLTPSLPYPLEPGRLRSWEWSMLAGACVDIAGGSGEQARLAWRILARAPYSPAHADQAISQLQGSGSGVPASQIYLDAHVRELSTAQIQSALAAQAKPIDPPDNAASTDRMVAGVLAGTEGRIGSALATRLLEQTAALKKPEYAAAERLVESLSLDPDEIVEALGRCSPVHLASVYRRLGVPAPLDLDLTLIRWPRASTS